MRLLVPWALATVLITSFLLPGAFYRLAFWTQVIFYALGVLGCCSAVASRSRLVSGIASFLVLNTAAWVAFWVWANGRTAHSWGKVAYDRPA